ncbi:MULTISPECIES: AAA family ATPase [unclassified Streptomyces]|uniref:AAA family ATPase n=1 Tax=unclassified Streptomyces TaxID=2593676 RepID=UPI00081EFD44|nr:LuxR family transcriptional regulator [Streptomyces sp. ScaeMP-e83]MYR94805.1 AAA family ATPase [Streptomyces sp. SID4937]SCD78533.1 regulatory protein, luxR family [Streptomyces sp. ScaeMP-e83]
MLYGRTTEQERLAKLVAGARAGCSGALLVRGEAGIGKTALLDWLAETETRADADSGTDGTDGRELRILRVTGVEPEADLAFGGLVQLLWPVQDRLSALPEPQAAALRAVLGTGGEQRGPDRFLTGLAVLTVLADLAEDGPLLCLVDDAQWLDQATAEALLFAARRLAAEGVAIVLAGRDDGFTAPGIPELQLSRLNFEDSSRLLADRGRAPALRSQIITESAGNPLALIEFDAARRDRPHQHAPLPVADRVFSAFRSQIGKLPERTRLMMLIAAAEGRGDLPLLLRASELLGVGIGDLEEAERTGLMYVMDGTVTFRHPLIASATYQGSVLARRIAVHRALAEAAADPDCRARHLLAVATGPDPEVAQELAAAAGRARGRTAYAAASGLYGHAARITTDHHQRASWLADAAALALAAGHAAQADRLAQEADELTDDPAVGAQVASVRAAVVFELGDQSEAAHGLLARVGDAATPETAGLLRTAAAYGWLAGDADAVRAAAGRLAAGGCADALVEGLDRLCEDDAEHGLPLLARFLAGRLDGPDTRDADEQAVRMLALTCGMILGDDEAALDLASAEVRWCRSQALIGELPYALDVLAQNQVLAGRHRDAEAAVTEAEEIARDTGMRQRLVRLGAVHARIAAIKGDAQRVRELADATPAALRTGVDCARVLLDLGLGDFDAALTRLDPPPPGPDRYTWLSLSTAADQVEAAVRLGRPERAEEALRHFENWAQAGTGAAAAPWAQAVVLRCRALLSDRPEEFTRALHLHEKGGRPFERARTELLYGEWLRRARRRNEARGVLRSALATFERLQAEPWMRRAGAELQAAGEHLVTARMLADNLIDRLTPQELQVVRLAKDGSSSREIAAQLFLSPRTVEHHLYKAYPKLGVGSRQELVLLDLT